MFKFSKVIDIALCRDNPDALVVFEDNLRGDGKVDTAIIRDEPNTFGIPTRRLSSGRKSIFSDREDECEAIKSKINHLWIEHKKGRMIILPNSIASGHAKLYAFSPEIYEMIEYFYFLARLTRILDEPDEPLFVTPMKKQLNEIEVVFGPDFQPLLEINKCIKKIIEIGEIPLHEAVEIHDNIQIWDNTAHLEKSIEKIKEQFQSLDTKKWEIREGDDLNLESLRELPFPLKEKYKKYT